RRLAFDELLILQLYLGGLRRRESLDGRAFVVPGALAEALVEALPFELTGAQQRALQEIGQDLARPVPMHRLLQGDVGAGKTLVALLGMLAAVDGGAQAALMAPTEILAEQHAATLRGLVASLGLQVHLLTGRLRKAQRREVLAKISSGEACLVVGTHALVQKEVEFQDLGFVVVDEQHRFGVLQRAALREKGAQAHLLVMTATPIPRSLALTLYGDLEVTVLDELPPGRLPVKTGWRPVMAREKALLFLCEEVRHGRQGYLVYPLVEASGKSELKAATQAFEELRAGLLSDVRLGLLHGRMSGDEKEAVMGAFRAGELDVLVSTTVVEVGVDVPNATVMMVEHAERFGLSQLHQLRGRVGRGAHASYCVLLVDPEEGLTPEARARLDTMAKTNDGFEIAEMDLKIRGPGQIFGTRQAGFPEFRFADLNRDADLVVSARREAMEILDIDPDLSAHGALLRRVRCTADVQMQEAG
ncbi:MAG: ATP-dependent DNA helicase RecG, partial [bacterium]|nr:ATP-dependent DNA helicase RecG [bacterium]